jgi:nicotinamidase-related amidase
MTVRPSFFDEKKIGQLYVPNLTKVKEEAARVTAKPSVKDKPGEKVAALLIDCQVDFCLAPPIGNLYVDGAEVDMFRIIDFIFNNLEKITTIYPTLDTHLVFQIFYGYWWIDENGKHPAPFTAITSSEIENGKYKPVIDPIWSLDYVRSLEKQANKPLMIWPEHTMLGTPGHALVPSLYEVAYYHAAVRKSQISFQIKGDVPETEMYGVFSPEVKVPKNPRGGINTAFLNLLGKYDKLLIMGEASSHCVLETLRQLADFFKNQPEVLNKMFIFEDCMSPVKHPAIDFAAIVKTEFAKLKKQGLNIVKSTDKVL